MANLCLFPCQMVKFNGGFLLLLRLLPKFKDRNLKRERRMNLKKKMNKVDLMRAKTKVEKLTTQESGQEKEVKLHTDFYLLYSLWCINFF